ncbi:MAG: hypothetical protein ACI4EF_06460 [Coprococcus sp.]
MKKPKNELMIFVAGLVMLVAGLFILSQRVIVYSSLFSGGGLRLGGLNVTAGLIIVPFIIGVVWMFMTGSFASKVFTSLSVLVIIIAIIMSTNFHLNSMTMFDWILILVLIFGGLGFIGKVVLADPDRKKSKNDEYQELKERMDELDRNK